MNLGTEARLFVGMAYGIEAYPTAQTQPGARQCMLDCVCMTRTAM